MSLVFNVCAALLLVVAAWLTIGRPPAQPGVAPQAALIAAFTHADLVLSGEKAIASSERLFSFTASGCAEPIRVLYLGSIIRVSDMARRLAAARNHSAQVVYDGRVVDGLGFNDLFWRWLWRKLVMTVTLEERNPWSSSVTVLLVPIGCRAPAVDWAALQARGM